MDREEIYSTTRTIVVQMMSSIADVSLHTGDFLPVYKNQQRQYHIQYGIQANSIQTSYFSLFLTYPTDNLKVKKGTIFTYRDQSSGKEINRYLRFLSNACSHWSTLTCNATTRTAADVNTIYNVRMSQDENVMNLMKSIITSVSKKLPTYQK